MENEDQIQPEVPILPPIEVHDIPDMNLYVETHHNVEPL